MTDKDEQEVILSQEEVWNVIEFAKAMSSGMYGITYLNPEIVSGRLKDITLNPVQATQDMLDIAMLEPKSHESQLQEFSQSFELTSMVYKRLISYLANMLAFDITYTSTARGDDYKTPKYRKDLEAVENFLEKFDYKKELAVVVREMLRNDAYFGCFRDTGNRYILQELPSDYCKITGRWEGGFLFSFNMYWFLQPGVDIEMYPQFFKKKYKEIWQSPNTIRNYNPALPPEMRDKSSWVYWVDVPTNVGTCFKLSPELATRLPYFAPIFNDLILQPTMRALQKNMNMAAASKMIMGEVPLLNKEAKATVKDSIAISPDLLGKFMALVKSAISDAIKVASAPLQNIRPISFETDNTMYDSYLRTALASSGINTNLIFTSSVKPNAIETQLSLNVDEQMMTALYQQFNEFMNYQANKVTRTFKFYFEFEGTDFFTNRDSRFDKAMSLFDKGIVMPQKIAAALGMKPAHLRKHMEEAAAMGFVKSLTPPSFEQQKEMAQLNQDNALESQKIAQEAAEKNQQIAADNQLKAQEQQAKLKPATTGTSTKTGSSESKSAGRPKKKLSELGEEGMQTRTEGTNISRAKKPYKVE